MKKITLPSPTLMVFGSLAAFWIAEIIHPGFNPIGVMILLFIPLLIIELLYPKEGLKEQFELLYPTGIIEEPVAGELVDESVNKSE